LTKKEIYFDNAATTRLDKRVFEKMVPFLNEFYGNPSSIHSYGRKVRVAVEEARETIANFINADASEIYFVSGGTEANNFPVFGIAKTEFIESGRNTIVSTSAEHHCVLEPIEELSKSGFNVKLTSVDSKSILEEESFKKNLSPDVSLASVIFCNNETRAVNQIEKLAEFAHSNNTYFHTDAVQAFGKIPLDVKTLHLDSMSFSSHKINGPKGAGAVFVKSGTPLSPLIFGGSQERNRRGGTENPASIIGFSEAVKLIKSEMTGNFEKVKTIRDKFLNGIREVDQKGIDVNGGDNVLPYIASITFKNEFYNNDPEAILMYLDINGIAASNGAACTSGTLKPSHVILAMGRPLEDAQGTIRFSFSAENTIDEVDYALEIIEKMTKKFSKK
jgi:cysteine desulfurase